MIMKRIKKVGISSLMGLLAIVILANWGSESSQVSRPRPAVNFEGTLKTAQGENLKIQNITFHGKFRQIPMYDAPVGKKAAKREQDAKLNEKTGLKEVILKKHPKDNFVVTKIDLDEVLELHVTPDPIWVYQEPEKARRVVFVKIDIVSNDEKKTKKSYLVEETTKLFCDEINEAGLLEKEVPLTAIEQLIISGHEEHREGVHDAPQNSLQQNKLINNQLNDADQDDNKNINLPDIKESTQQLQNGIQQDQKESGQEEVVKEEVVPSSATNIVPVVATQEEDAITRRLPVPKRGKIVTGSPAEMETKSTEVAPTSVGTKPAEVSKPSEIAKPAELGNDIAKPSEVAMPAESIKTEVEKTDALAAAPKSNVSVVAPAVGKVAVPMSAPAVAVNTVASALGVTPATTKSAVVQADKAESKTPVKGAAKPAKK